MAQFISAYAEINNGCRDASRDSTRDDSNTAANEHLLFYMSLKSEYTVCVDVYESSAAL